MLRKIILFYFLLLSNVSASDEGEAISAILNEATRYYVDSNEIWIGGTAEVAASRISPAFHFGSRTYFSKKYGIGASIYFPRDHEPDDSRVYGGLDLGLKQFNPIFGRHRYSLLLGGGKFNGESGFLLQPNLTFVLKESKTIRYFWLMHNVGMNVSLSYRHMFPQDDPFTQHSSNTISLTLNIYLKHRNKAYK